MKQFQQSIDKLVGYAQAELGLTRKNADYVRNGIMEMFGAAFPYTGAKPDGTVTELLDEFVRTAVNAGVFAEDEAERYCDAVMGALSLSPQDLQNVFDLTEIAKGSKAATDYFYNYCVKNNYVKKSALDKNPRFESDGLIITINKAKPEFRDAKKAAAGNAVGGGYPSCTICHENEGFSDRRYYARRAGLVLAIFALRIFPSARNSGQLRTHAHARGQSDVRSAYGFCRQVSALLYRQ